MRAMYLIVPLVALGLVGCDKKNEALDTDRVSTSPTPAEMPYKEHAPEPLKSMDDIPPPVEKTVPTQQDYQRADDDAMQSPAHQ